MGRPFKVPAKGGGDARRTPCRYFARGKCREGDKCRFLHDNHLHGKREGGEDASSKKTLPANDAKASPADPSSGQIVLQKSSAAAGGPSTHSVIAPKPKRKQPCLSCLDTSEKLVALRTQTESGLQLIGKMESAFSELSRLARSNLEQTMRKIEELESSSRELVSSEGNAPKKAGTVAQGCPRETDTSGSKADGGEKGTDRSVTPPSFASKAGSNVFGFEIPSAADCISSSSTPSASLDGIISAYAPFMTDSPQGYMESLYNEFGVHSFDAADIIEIFEDCLDVLASIDAGTSSEEDVRLRDTVLGSIAVGVQKDFCKEMVSAAKAADEVERASSKGEVDGRGSPISVTSDLTVSAGERPKDAPCGSKEKVSKKRAEKKSVPRPLTLDGVLKSAKKDAWKPLVAATGGKKTAQVAVIGKKLSTQPRREYSLSTARKAAPRTSGLDKPSAKEADVSKVMIQTELGSKGAKKGKQKLGKAVEHDEQKQPNAARTVKQKQQDEQKQPNEVWKAQRQNEYMTSYVCEAEQLIASQRRVSRSEAPKKLCAKTMISIEEHRLPSYIKPIQQSKDASVAPIFRLLRNRETVPDARELLCLERKAQEQRDVVAELRRKRAIEETAFDKITSEFEDFTKKWTGEKGEESKLKARIRAMEKVVAGDPPHEPTKAEALKEQIDCLKAKRTILGLAKAFDEERKAKEREIREVEVVLEQLQKETEEGETAAANANEEGTNKGRELKTLGEEESKQSEPELNAAGTTEKKTKTRKGLNKEQSKEQKEQRKEQSNEKKQETVASTLLILRARLEEGAQMVAEGWPAKIDEKKIELDEYDAQIAVAIKNGVDVAQAEIQEFLAARLTETVPDARELLRLEGKVQKQRDTVAELERQKNRVEKKTNVDERRQKKELMAYDAKIAAAMKLVSEAQAEVQAFLASDQKTVRFDIDVRDEREHTVLMHCAQTNDPTTASICLHMGADVHAVNPEGLKAIDYSYFFKFDDVTRLILEHGGAVPTSQVEAWKFLPEMAPSLSKASHSSWEDTLRTAAVAAVPAGQYLKSPESCEMDETKRMEILSDDDIASTDFTCFEARLLEPNINSDQVHRVVLVDKEVYTRLLTATADATAFVAVVEGLMPCEVRRPGVLPTKCHRRGIVGTTATFEVLAARLSAKSDDVVIFSPFVSGESEGVTSVGVVVWAIAPDQEASMYKTLLASTEFMRNKPKMKDRFLPHKELCLELGADMHLLDLTSTSIWNTATMQLYTLNVDKGDLDRVSDSGFHANKRIVYSEEMVNRALFHASEDETAKMHKTDGILAAEKSSLIRGGAGVGKTLLLIRKVCHEDPSRRILVVSRLPRLVNVIKIAVEEKRSDDTRNVTFSTYEELMQLLAKRVTPDDDSQQRSFVRCSEVHFDCDDEGGVSFNENFVGKFSDREKKKLREACVEALTLWQAITTIKSACRCAVTKKPLSLEEYLALPARFGLTQEQRELCYNSFQKYERWKSMARAWDEMDRSMYILEHGPSVFRDSEYVPWKDRVYKRGELDLLGEDGGPLAPFFFDMVFADEAQDFSAIDQALLLRMSDTRSAFLNLDPAQSVEQGVKMNGKGVNDVFFSLCEKGTCVNDVLQVISLKTNHRTHEENLRLATAVRKLLARSFKIPVFEERALIRGKIPKTLRVNKIDELTTVFRGANCVFIAPDEKVPELRIRFRELGIENDLLGVREAKGLEFDSVALIGFFAYIDERGNGDAWKNALRWLSSSAGITETRANGGLEDCDYRMTNPEVSDEAMLLYTALTRARNQLYLIEADCAIHASNKGRFLDLAEYAFWKLNELELVQSVDAIDEGQGELTPAQHKARGVLKVVQALSMIQRREPFDLVRKKFLEATDHFGPNQGNDRPLLVQSRRHLQALEAKREINRYAKAAFYSAGVYNVEGRFAEVLLFETMASSFFSSFLGDSYIMEEVKEVRCLVEELFFDTPYEFRFKDVCQRIDELGQFI